MSRVVTTSSNAYLENATNVVPDITTGALTVSAWIRWSDLAAPRIIGRWGAGPTARYLLEVANPNLQFAILGSDAGGQLVTGSTVLTTGAWFHVLGLWEASTRLDTYVAGVRDGHLTSSVKSGLSSVGSPKVFTIGADVGDVNHGAGRIADVALWNVALSDGEILALAMGTPANRIRPGSALKTQDPLWGVAYPEPDLSGNAGAISTPGTVAAADHAPVGTIVALAG